MLKILALVLLMQQPIHGVDFECLNYSPQLKLNLSEKVEILSTKTTYMVARQYIKSRYPSKWPLETNFCTPVYFFFLSRHSIRFPSAKWIKILRDFSAELKPHLLQSNAVPQDFKSRLENWKYGFADEDDNHVTLSGFHTTGEIAKIFYHLFPELLDIRKAHFDVGVSAKIRTTETADAFINGLIEEQLDEKQCIGDRVEETNLFKETTFRKKNIRSLTIHGECKKILEKKKNWPMVSPLLESFTNSKAMQELVNIVQKRLDGFKMNVKKLISLYSICQYENAIFGSSVWCELLDIAELETMEYYYDIDNYYDAYNITPFRDIGCYIYKDMAEKFQTYIHNQTDQKRATLYFSHENLFSRLIAYFGLYSSWDGYHESNDRFCLPQSRDWRSSFLIPFNTNFAHILYKCSGKHKILTLHNENPVTIAGCKGPLCDFDDFLARYKPTFEGCDIQKICTR